MPAPWPPPAGRAPPDVGRRAAAPRRAIVPPEPAGRGEPAAPGRLASCPPPVCPSPVCKRKNARKKEEGERRLQACSAIERQRALGLTICFSLCFTCAIFGPRHLADLADRARFQHSFRQV